ncbi:hypothetical protein ACV60T_06115, partial [Pseudomonas aeruginosa]
MTSIFSVLLGELKFACWTFLKNSSTFFVCLAWFSNHCTLCASVALSGPVISAITSLSLVNTLGFLKSFQAAC